MALTYIDANVLVYALLPIDHAKQAAARKLLKAACGRDEAITCALAIDELVWAVRRETGPALAVEVGRLALEMPGLSYAPVTKAVAAGALDLVDAHGLAPRDAIHAAVALASGCSIIASDDRDFDKVPGLERAKV